MLPRKILLSLLKDLLDKFIIKLVG